MIIWDTPGNERDTPWVSSKADAIILCYDITRKISCERLKFWTTECDIPNDVVMVLVGCKADLKDWSGEVPSAKRQTSFILVKLMSSSLKFQQRLGIMWKPCLNTLGFRLCCNTFKFLFFFFSFFVLYII